MENNKYPTIKNGLLLILLLMGITFVSGIVMVIICKMLSIDFDSPIVDILGIIITILGYLIVFRIGLKKSKRKFNEIFKFNRVPVLVWLFLS
jgi:hypothetical protein